MSTVASEVTTADTGNSGPNPTPAAPVAPLEMVGPMGAAAILQVSRQREHILRQREDYPAPAACVDGDPSRPVWHAATIREYATTRKANR
jgi:hypothetical protein